MNRPSSWEHFNQIHWHKIAEKLTEAGWSWQHSHVKESGLNVHVVEVHNEKGITHAAVAKAVGPAFTAVEQSIQSVK